MDFSILTWLKRSKPMHSMPLSMLLSWTESLDHLEHVMGPCWCFWAGPHHEEMDGDLNTIKLKIPNFQGKNDPEAYLEWEKKVD